MKMKGLFLAIFSLVSAQVFGQAFDHLDVPVEINGQILQNGLVGGLNSPQLSKGDLNNDGLEDLYIFDRIGDVHLTFLNQGTVGEADYLFAPEYARNFPTFANNWSSLYDYNQDGISDLFVSVSIPFQGVRAYRGYFDAEDRLAFDPYITGNTNEGIFFTQFDNNQTQVYVNPIDIPAFDDLDNDGDTDILSFSVNGSYVIYYRNKSADQGFGADSLLFVSGDICWGKFYESSFSEEIVLSPDPNVCATGFLDEPNLENRHAGSTLATIDMDNDGDKELFLGDIIYPKITYLVNGGTPNGAYMTDQDVNFPSNDFPVNIPEFPAPFFLDMDNDGLKDFVAAPNNVNSSLNYHVVWFYKNMNTNEDPVFEFQQDDLLVEGMVDYGRGSSPTVVDYNADGLLDILIGTDGFFVPGGIRDPRLVLFKNVGTSTEPAFDLVNDDYLEFSQYSDFSWNFNPTFGDLDSDGDQDLLVGEQEGRLFYLENVAGAGNPVLFNTAVPEWLGIDVGQNSTPFIIDLNRDGLKDLVLGDRNGHLNFFPNIGTASDPMFEADETLSPNNPFLGEVDTELPGIPITGNSSPWIIDLGDDFVIFTGSEVGPIQVYGNIEGNLELGQSFTQLDNFFGEIREGERSRPALADLNDDGFFEVVVGNLRGGLAIYGTDVDATGVIFSTNELAQSEHPFKLFPNPSTDQVTLSFDQALRENLRYSLVNSLGQEVQSGVFSAQTNKFSVAGLVPGVYWVQVLAVDGRQTGKSLVVY